MSAPLLRVAHVSKTFAGVKALTEVSMDVHANEVVALLGHNGSGKSTLVKILAGVHRPDPGGEITHPSTDGSGEHGQIHVIHQDLGLIPMLSTVENLDLGHDLRGSTLLPAPRRRERQHARGLIRDFGADFDVTVPVAQLTPAERTIVAIARALDGWTSPHHVLILDEPTAALHGQEAEKLFEVVRSIAARGAGIVFISHRLDEVVDLADRVIVLRNGTVAATRNRGEFDHDALVHLIAGAEPEPRADDVSRRTGPVRLSLSGVRGPGLQGIDVDVHAGEIVGVSGLVGSGVEHICGTAFGSTPRLAGTVEVDGNPLPNATPAAAIRAGVGFVPADRRRFGAVMTHSARENLTLPRLRPLTRRDGSVDRVEERAEARRWLRTVDVRPAHPERPVALFSGGNQQKIVMAKWLRNAPGVLLLDEPTQGVDVGAKAGIYALIAEAAAAGTAILIAASDTKELAEICDRVIVLRDGAQVDELVRPDLTEGALVRAVVGSGSVDASSAEHHPSPTAPGATS